MSLIQIQFDDISFDLILDKAELNEMACQAIPSENVKGEIKRILASKGILLVISLVQE